MFYLFVAGVHNYGKLINISDNIYNSVGCAKVSLKYKIEIK